MQRRQGDHTGRPASSHKDLQTEYIRPLSHRSRTTEMTIRSRTARPHTGSRTPEPVPNWTKLSRTDQVEIHNHGRVITSGRIDMLAMDGSVLWLQQDEGKGRALFLHSDGLRVYRRP
jgi:hypothetical protein